MAYATRADLEARYGSGEIATLAEDDADPAIDRIVLALADAAAVIDAHLAIAYALPLPGAEWPLLRDIACDLARAALYDDAGLDAPRARMRRALDRLAALRDGRLSLVDSAGNLRGRQNHAGRAGPAPVMTALNLAGFAGRGTDR